MNSVILRLNPVYQKIYKRAKPFLQTRKNVIHTQIALRYALKLLKEERGDDKIVLPGILLHDVGWKALPEPLQLTAFGPNPSNPNLTRLHEREGARIAKSILEKLHYPSQKIEEICQIINGHDSRKRPLSWNDRVVKDADKLWRYSRKGMAIDLDRFHMPRRDYLIFLEASIEPWFLTPTGMGLAKKEILLRKRDKP